MSFDFQVFPPSPPNKAGNCDIPDIEEDVDTFDEDVASFLGENKNKSTTYNTANCVSRLNRFLSTESKNQYKMTLFEFMEEKELDKLICDFFMNAKKLNGKGSTSDLYQPDTLNNFRNGWQRHLVSLGKSFDLKSGSLFKRSQDVMKARRKQLTQMGLGNKPNATRPLDLTKINQLFSSGFFGASNPLALQTTVWWKITDHFGLRARDESRKLKYGDLKLKKDTDGRNFLEWDKERGTKTRTGEKTYSHQRAFNPRAYETGGERCVVHLYKLFQQHRPEESKTTDSPFFLAMIPDDKIKSNFWYFNRPLGVNTIGKFMSNAGNLLSNDTNTSRSKISNHSARKTAISTLLNKEVHPIHVSQLSGHRQFEIIPHSIFKTARKHVGPDQ